jgi:hypothetical protein
MGKDLNSAHRFATTCLENLKNQSCHIKKIVKRQTTQEILNNWLYIKASIDIVWAKIVKRQTTQEILNNWLYIKASIDIICWLTFQACAFRGHNERPE